jgi:phage shock protein PspC (stress-responsive transcriptional regulator)
MTPMEPQSATAPRLVRRSEGKLIAGVCKGIADHFGVDPILVRIVFVVITFFGGAGVIAYAAAWLLIPEEDETTSLGERILRERRWGRIAGFVLIAIAVSSLLRPVWWAGGHGLFAVLLIIGGLYLLSPGFSGAKVWPDDSAPPRSEPAGAGAPSGGLPPTDEYGVVPPPPPAAPRPRRRGGLGALTFGLLFVGGGVVGLLLAAGNTVEPTYVFAVGLLIVGAALVVSTWFGRSYVLIPIGVVLVGLMSVSTVIDVPITGGVGGQQATPFTFTELQDEYHLGMGELQLDLSHLPFERGSVHTVTATVGIGHLLVTLPRNATAELHGHAGLGEVRFLGQHDGGIRIDRDTTLSSGGESPPRIVLDMEVGIGQVEVVDAAA